MLRSGTTDAAGSSRPRIRLAALGRVQVFRDGTEAQLAGGRPYLILALLLARAGQPVGAIELINLLWGSEPPPNAMNMLHRHVGVIRRALEPGLPFRAEGGWLTRAPGGYHLRADPAVSDVHEFRSLVARATAATSPETAVPDWVAALSLWRGPYADGLTAATAKPAAFVAMDQEWAAAATAAAAAARQVGAGDALLPLVQGAAEQNLLDERLAAELLMLLAERGRSVEAISWYQRVSDALADQLGISPGSALAAVRQSLTGVVPEPAVPSARPAQLPSDLWLFSGREAELTALTTAAQSFAGTGVIAVDGIPGVGKSTLATHWAHTVTHRYPDGQLFANMRGFGPAVRPADPSEVLASFLEALGVPASEIPADPQARAGLFRTVTARSRLLIVLDNARTVEQIRPLIPAAPGCLVLVTSRARLTSLAAHDGATLISLDLPEPADAREDLRRRLASTDRKLSDQALDEVLVACGRLPLAVSILAAQAGAWSGGIAELLTGLRESRGSLDAFDDELGGVRAVFSWSYHQLSPEAARLFRLLPTQTGPDSALPLLASLAGRPRRPVGQLIRELLRARLLSEVRPGRYAQHDLIAVYATELAADHDPPIEQEQGAERLLDHFTRTVQSINVRHLRPLLQTIEGDPAPGVSPETFDDVLPALDWYRAEMDTMCAALLDAYRRGRNPWPTVVDSFRAYLRLNRFLQWEKFARPSLVAAMAAGDRMAEAHLRRTLGHLTAILHTDEEGAAEFRRSLALFESLGAEVEQAAVEENLAEIHALAWEPDYRRAVPHYERAAALFAANGHQTGRLYALIELGRCQLELGRTEQGIATLTEGLEAFLHTGDLYRAAIAFWHLGAAARRPDTADFLLMSHRLYAEAGDRFWVLVTGLWLGEAYLAAGRWHDAYAVWRRAQEDHTALTSEPTSTISDDMRTRLARLTAAFDPPS